MCLISRMRIMKILILATCFTSAIFAQTLKVEPLYGFERTYRIEPAPAKYVTRNYLGARATYGTSLLSGELEVSQSEDKDSFPDSNQSIEYTIIRALLGIKSYPIRSEYFGAYARAGGRYRKEDRTIETNGVTTEDKGEGKIDPYAGAGLTVALNNFFALDAGVTYIYNDDMPSGKEWDRQLSLSISFKLGNR